MKDNDKEKFTFVNDIESDIEDQPEAVQGKPLEASELLESEKSKFENISKLEYEKRTSIIKIVIILVVISVIVFVFTLIWQNDTTIMGICNSLWLVAVLQFFIGWIMFMNNLRIFAPLAYGVKSFAKMLIGRKMNDDYYTYVKSREDQTIPKFYYRICFIAALITVIPATILLIILL